MVLEEAAGHLQSISLNPRLQRESHLKMRICFLEKKILVVRSMWMFADEKVITARKPHVGS